MKKGKITAIHGPMFSGKTEELLRRIRRARVAKKTCLLFKPISDGRYSRQLVLPHHLAPEAEKGEFGEQAHPVQSPAEIHELIEVGTNLVGIEEGQFFDDGLFDLLHALSDRGIDVVMSFLDMDFRRRPFPIPDSNRTVGDYLAIAHESLKLSAVCVRCGAEAQYSQKLVYVREYPNGEPIYVPASFHEEVVVVGTNLGNTRAVSRSDAHPERIYEARCLDCHVVPDAPRSSFESEVVGSDVASGDGQEYLTGMEVEG